MNDKPVKIEMVTLKQLCAELKADPREARERLRLAVRDIKKNPELKAKISAHILHHPREPLSELLLEPRVIVCRPCGPLLGHGLLDPLCQQVRAFLQDRRGLFVIPRHLNQANRAAASLKCSWRIRFSTTSLRELWKAPALLNSVQTGFSLSKPASASLFTKLSMRSARSLSLCSSIRRPLLPA